MINRDKVVNFIGELNNFLNQSGSQLLMADRLISRQQNLINNFFNRKYKSLTHQFSHYRRASAIYLQKCPFY